MRAILIGATGLVGGLLLQELLDDAAFLQVKVIARRPVNRQHTKLETAIIDFNDEERFKKEVTDADVLFCCIGTTLKKVRGDKAAYRKIDFDIAVKAAVFCAANGIAKYILVSSVGADADSSNFYLQLKGETENAVMAASIPAIYILRPSILLGNRNEMRLGETMGKAVMRFLSFFLFGNAARYRAIYAGDVAAAMVAASKKTDPGRFICGYSEIMSLINKG